MRRFLPLILFVSLIQTSCSTEEPSVEQEREIAAKVFDLQYLEKQRAAQDYNDLLNIRNINLYKNLNETQKSQEKPFDQERFDELINKDDISQVEKEDLLSYLSYLGFANKQEYFDFAQSIENLVLALAETDFFELDNTEQVSIFTQYFVKQNQKSGSKQSELEETCKDEAQAEHTVGIVACTGASIGVGAITGGVGGVIFQSFCLAANMDRYMAQLNSCEAQHAS